MLPSNFTTSGIQPETSRVSACARGRRGWKVAWMTVSDFCRSMLPPFLTLPAMPLFRIKIVRLPTYTSSYPPARGQGHHLRLLVH